MAKHKLPRKSTHIDMTAMCDVAFLLLTFFMLATKFKPDEPVVVKTPSSISDIIMPENSILLTVDPSGKVFFDYDNKKAKAILIDKGGKGFYNRTVKQTKDLERYDTYRTYKTNHIRNVKELYFDLSKLKTQLGFKNYNINETE